MIGKAVNESSAKYVYVMSAYSKGPIRASSQILLIFMQNCLGWKIIFNNIGVSTVEIVSYIMGDVSRWTEVLTENSDVNPSCLGLL
jgi:hypothetical protein